MLSKFSVSLTLGFFATSAAADVWYHRSLTGEDAQARFITDQAECAHDAQTLSPTRQITQQEHLQAIQRNLGCLPPYCAPEPLLAPGLYGDVRQNRKLYGACMYQRGWELRSE